MSKIKQLSHEEAQKIAAGEVVERPANIVKELIENALDAGATAIVVYIEDGGKKSIRVVDNGCGMDSDDALLCFNRHATSKISRVSDLETVLTFGFRGEALSSIASVARVRLVTQDAFSSEATVVVASDGQIKKEMPVAFQIGTDITVSDLFFNIPARKSFLKSTDTEWRQIQLLFNAFCADYIGVRFTLYHNAKQIAHYPGVDFLAMRAMQLWSADQYKNNLQIEKTAKNEYAIEGVISNHQQYRYDKTGILFFINHRWIKNYQLYNAVIKGYANVLPQARYPLAIIHLTVPTNQVDINIHPKKEEVRFLHPHKIEQLITQVVSQALERSTLQSIAVNNNSHETKELFSFTQKPFSSGTYDRPFNFESTAFSPFVDEKNAQDIAEPLSDIFVAADIAKGEMKEFFVPKVDDLSIQKNVTDEVRIIGQFDKTYILLERNDGLFIIDQHAAHERILYEKFAQKLDAVASVQLLFPLMVYGTQEDVKAASPYLYIFHEHGIMIDQHADNCFIIRSLPVHLASQAVDEIVKDFISWVVENKALSSDEFQKTINHKLQAQMACKSAVKAGDELSHQEMIQLIKDLEKTANRFSCPHGRPTGWLFLLSDLEKKFKRIL